MDTSLPTLSIENLCVDFATRAGPISILKNVSLNVGPGEIVGLVGESGSGKSVTGLSVMRLLDQQGKITGGRILFQEENLLEASERRIRDLRGARIAMIFQDPLMTLNPVLRIDTQMIEAVQTHNPSVSREEARRRSRAALAQVGIPSPEERLKAYPHQFSGGMRQRVAIAIALLNHPDLILADEPTTALDVTIQAQILYEVQKLCRNSGTSLIWITHDLSVVAGLVDRIYVMYAGCVVESGTVDQVLDHPLHPYTHGLIRSVPGRNAPGAPLFQIPGMTPSPFAMPEGCPFRPRCPRNTSQCLHSPVVQRKKNHAVSCFHPHLEEGLT